MSDYDGASARVIADSVSPRGVRLTTLEVRFWRPILAEFNTHRVFSRNSASSRARSLKVTINEVRSRPYVPDEYPTEQRGMVGGEPLEDGAAASAEMAWYTHARHAVETAEKLAALGVHKSLVNRLLEPFSWHVAVVTATDWENFFSQRLALRPDGRPESDPEMYALAVVMRDALDGGEPEPLEYGEWHLPYVTPEELLLNGTDSGLLRKASVARCAGVSYLTQGRAGRDPVEDARLYNRLRGAQPPHWSPFEHVARPDDRYDDGWYSTSHCYNLRGWQSLRWVENNVSISSPPVTATSEETHGG